MLFISFTKYTVRGLVYLGVLATVTSQPLFAEKPEVLEKAWQEYQFLSMEVAESYFQEALKQDTEELYLQEAKIGLAMVSQFRERGGDLEVSEKLYQDVLEQDPPEETRRLIHSFLADLYLSRGEDEKALDLLNSLIETSPESVLGQDALIRKTILIMGAYGSPESLAAAAEVETILSELDLEVSQERPYLLPMIHSLVGDIYFWAANYSKSVVHLDAFSRIGNPETTSYGSQAAMLYRLAKIYENKLNQPELAGQYYRRLIIGYPNVGMSYYSLERAIQYKTITRSEVEDLRLNGLTLEILDELFAQSEGEEN